MSASGKLPGDYYLYFVNLLNNLKDKAGINAYRFNLMAVKNC
jgi:hypothetical protein